MVKGQTKVNSEAETNVNTPQRSDHMIARAQANDKDMRKGGRQGQVDG